jgi:uncharacterized protein related to proFAR isomerase
VQRRQKHVLTSSNAIPIGIPNNNNNGDNMEETVSPRKWPSKSAEAIEKMDNDKKDDPDQLDLAGRELRTQHVGGPPRVIRILLQQDRFGIRFFKITRVGAMHACFILSSYQLLLSILIHL